MTHVSMTTGIAVESITSGRNGSWNGARRYASPITIGKSAAHVKIAIFHFPGGLDGAGIPGSVNQVSNPDLTCDEGPAALTASASRSSAVASAERCHASRSFEEANLKRMKCEPLLAVESTDDP